MSTAAVFAPVPPKQSFVSSSSLFPEVWPPIRVRDSGSSLQATGVDLLNDETEWFVESVEATNRLASLKADWDSYGAVPPNSISLLAARTVLAVLASADVDFRPTSIDASAEGGVCLAFSRNDRYADIECFNSGEIWAIVAKDGIDPIVWQVENNPQAVRDTARDIRLKIAL